MNCEDLRSRLDRYLDGELSEKEENAVRDHLRNCDNCARAARERKTIGTILESHSVPEPPDSLKNNIMDEAIKQEHDSVGTRGNGRTVSVNRLAAAAIFLVGLLLGLSVQVWMSQGLQSGRQRRKNQSRPPLFEVQPVGSLSELVNPQTPQRPGGQP